MAVAEERVHDLEGKVCVFPKCLNVPSIFVPAVFRYESASKKDRRSLLKKYAIGMVSQTLLISHSTALIV